MILIVFINPRNIIIIDLFNIQIVEIKIKKKVQNQDARQTYCYVCDFTFYAVSRTYRSPTDGYF